MGLALSGLASGFDWKSIVDQLIEVSRAPQNRMRTEKSQLATKNSAINEINGLVSSFKSSLTSLNSAEGFQKKSAAFASSTTTWSATADTDAPSGTYEFEFVQKATAAKLTGSYVAKKLDEIDDSIFTGGANSGDSKIEIPLSNLPVGRTITAGTFTVEGAQVTVSTSDTLDDVTTAIMAATRGDIIANYNPGTDRIDLTNMSGGSISLGASNDTSNFLLAMRLSSGGSATVSSSSNLSSVLLTGPISNSNLVTSGTSISINGVSITRSDGMDFDPSTDSLQDVINQINASTAGVTASFDSTNGNFILTNKNTGNVGVSVSGSLAVAMGLTSGTTLTAGSDAQFKINDGGIITSRSNTIDESVHGITGLTVNAKFDDNPANVANNTQTITVSGDTSATKAAINTFIEKYNAVQNVIEKYTKVTVDKTKVSSAVLAGSRELATISRDLRSILYKTVQDSSGNAVISGSIQRLADLGVGFSGIENTISITNSSLLDTALTTKSDDVIEYLASDTNGLMDRLDSILERMVSTSSTSPGTFQVQVNSISSQNKSLDKQIEEFERRLASQRSLLESSFIAMEKAQSTFQQQSSYLAKTFSGNSK